MSLFVENTREKKDRGRLVFSHFSRGLENYVSLYVSNLAPCVRPLSKHKWFSRRDIQKTRET
jgi:hypothetical protein